MKTTRKTKRVLLHLEDEDKFALEQAARLTGVKTSDFVLAAALAKADSILEDKTDDPNS